MNTTPAVPDLNDLLARCRDQPWLYGEVVEAVQVPLLRCLKRLARLRGLAEQDAEDCLQEGLMRGFVKVEGYAAERGSAFSWLWTICVRCLLDRARSAALRRAVSLWDKEGNMTVDP
jgi:DNA-directed RNA polymerase specialized sigma24 family protein